MSKLVITLPEMERLKFKRWLESQSEKTRRECQTLIHRTAFDIKRRAKMFAPVNDGFLKSSINTPINGNRMGATIEAGGQSKKGMWVKYAPYVEFGTGTGVIVPDDPQGLKLYAFQFKGAGKRKVNNRAQPYFFPAVRISINEMIVRLNQMGFK